MHITLDKGLDKAFLKLGKKFQYADQYYPDKVQYTCNIIMWMMYIPYMYRFWRDIIFAIFCG